MLTPPDMTVTISLINIGTVASSTLISIKNDVRLKVRGHHIFAAEH